MKDEFNNDATAGSSANNKVDIIVEKKKNEYKNHAHRQKQTFLFCAFSFFSFIFFFFFPFSPFCSCKPH